MDYFNYKENILHAEDVAIPDIAKLVGTPFYLYSASTFIRHYKVMSDALKLNKKLICFAVKANSNISILKLLAEQGAGADVVSQGEIFRALKAGVQSSKIVFSGVGKTSTEIAYALEKGIFQFNAESCEEIEQINQIAQEMNMIAPVAIRVNPNVGAGGNEKISTGKKGDKFGIDLDMAEEAVKLASKAKHVNFKGLSVHIGSQINNLSAFAAAFRKLFEFIQKLEEANYALTTIDLGGGVGVPYGDNETIEPVKYGELINQLVEEFKLEDKKFIFEPGRMIAANAGILIGSVNFIKKTKAKEFAIIDVGMNDLMRTALYDAKHQFVPVIKHSKGQKLYDFVGPVCETTDVFHKDLQFQLLESEDLIAIRSAGAYGAVMANEYNTRPLIPEVLVTGSDYNVIRRRPDYNEMISLEL
ncbi:MAG: diaminopimelate decarboxylase [Alphaproteobacteria bacterium]|jgi:diaminopimelate decarboxylase|nr:diaminopimelate decarboxylase [Alphaproteobacteria bacterium]MBT5827382.1 diaminopimelate decarboxylase [Alphaproteobacteria bacterium]